MVRITLTLLPLLLALPLSAGIWGSRGISREMLLSGTRLYAADGRGVTVYDVSNPASLSVVDVEPGLAETVDLARMGPSTLLAATERGVDRFTIEGDGSLTRISTWPSAIPVEKIAASASFAAISSGRDLTFLEPEGDGFRVRRRVRLGDTIQALAFAGEILYVSVEGEGIRLFAPPASEPIGGLATAPTDFALSGSILWGVAPDSGMTAIDVSNPREPRIVKKTDLPGIRPVAVAASGSLVVSIEPPGRIHLFEAAADGSATLTASLDEPVRTIAVSGTHFFFSGAPLDPEGLPLENGRPLRAWSVSAGAPQPAGEIVDLAGPVSGVWTDGSVALVVDRPWLRVIDVSRSEAPRQITAIVVPEIQDRIRVKEGIAVIYGRGLVNLVDVSQPLAPRHLGNWHTQGHPPSVAALAGGRLIEANMHSGLHVVDFSDPANPVQVGGRIWHYSDVVAGEDAIYAIQDWGVIVLELAGGTQVIERERLLMEAEQIELLPPGAAQPELLVVRGPDGVRLFSLENRFDPVEIAFVPADGTDDLATGETAAWVAQRGILARLDASNPAALEPTGMAVVSPMQISVAGEKIVVADRYSLRVYGPDTPSPRTPRRRALRH